MVTPSQSGLGVRHPTQHLPNHCPKQKIVDIGHIRNTLVGAACHSNGRRSGGLQKSLYGLLRGVRAQRFSALCCKTNGNDATRVSLERILTSLEERPKRRLPSRITRSERK
jgi:hypothetical protein